MLVDVPMIRGINWVERGEGVMPQDIEEAEQRCGFRVERAIFLMVRTGQLHRRNQEGPVDPAAAGSTACQAACLPLFHQRGIAMICSDTGNDVMPPQYNRLSNPIHQVGIVAMGLWILDNANLEDLAEACRQRQRWEFMMCMGPLRLFNGTGSPLNLDRYFNGSVGGGETERGGGQSVWDHPHEKLQLHLRPHTDALDIQPRSGFPC